MKKQIDFTLANLISHLALVEGVRRAGEGHSKFRNIDPSHKFLSSQRSLRNFSLSRKGRRCQCAFTLAETLITLGIIGVVAAMTMPTLIGNYQKKATATKVKKAYSELTQAIKLSEVQNGEMEYWDYGTEKTLESNETFFNKYIVPYFVGLEKCGEGNVYEVCGMPASSRGINYRLNNGSYISMVNVNWSNSVKPSPYITAIISTNKKANNATMGKDNFYFLAYNGKVEPEGWKTDLTREEIFEGYTYGKNTYSCKNVKTTDEDAYHRYGCTILLFIDGFEFKKDYPW